MSTVTVDFDTSRLVRDMKRAIVAIAVFAGAATLAHCNSGCTPPKSAAEVEAAYTAEIVHCSATAKNLAEAKACRTDVNTKYGLCPRDSWPRITPCDE